MEKWSGYCSLTPEVLESLGGPVVIHPAEGIVAIIADYADATIDLTYAQAAELKWRLAEILEEI